ncbi:Abi-alpha family protein [Limibacter armeniacum]|uniref:Abi-alpha family protein n=1 Tax=Limibacter armeniacum TaxID=466084 RepID=UPI002FE64AC5
MPSSQSLIFIQNIVEAPSRTFHSFAQWREDNQETVLTRTMQLIREFGIPLRKIQLKTLNAFLEHCSFEYDERVQEKWAVLLANAVTATNQIKSHYTFMELLRQLSYEELKMLDFLFEDSFIQFNNERTFFNKAFFLQVYVNELHMSYQDAEIALENIHRLGLLEYARPKIDQSKWLTEQEPEILYPANIRLSLLGMYFTRECNQLV